MTDTLINEFHVEFIVNRANDPKGFSQSRAAVYTGDWSNEYKFHDAGCWTPHDFGDAETAIEFVKGLSDMGSADDFCGGSLTFYVINIKENDDGEIFEETIFKKTLELEWS